MQAGGGSTLQSKQRWCEIEGFTSRFIHSCAKLFPWRLLGMWVNESAANSTPSTSPEWTEGRSLPSGHQHCHDGKQTNNKLKERGRTQGTNSRPRNLIRASHGGVSLRILRARQWILLMGARRKGRRLDGKAYKAMDKAIK